jgi:hypothetical protein
VDFLLEESVTNEEVMEKIKECAAAIGHAPSLRELSETTGMKQWRVHKYFSSYKRALQLCGLERGGAGHAMGTKERFVSWAKVVRTLKKVPTMYEYVEHSKNDKRTILRWVGSWSHTPQRMLEYIRMADIENEWKDVEEVILRHFDPRRGEPFRAEPPVRPSEETSQTPSRGPFQLLEGPLDRGMVTPGKPVYGTPLLRTPLNCAPLNEMGVVFLFGAVARELGFMVTRLQSAFPDCEAFRQVEPDRWQKVLIEFEYESRNFLAHGHNVDDCDLIVCWRNNWVECPLEVVELRSLKCLQL